MKEQDRKDWLKLDWSKQNVELSSETGYSAERIRQVRKELGFDISNSNHQRPENAALVAMLEEGDWVKKTLGQVTKAVGFENTPANRNKVYGILYRRSIVFKHSKVPVIHPWQLVNWELPNNLIERIWKFPFNMTASYRMRNQKQPAIYRYRKGQPMKGLLLKAHKQETIKANRWYAKQTRLEVVRKRLKAKK